MKFISVDIECDQPSGEIIQIGASAWDTDTSAEVSTFDHYLDIGEVNWACKLDRGCTLEELLAPGFKRDWEVLKIPVAQGLENFWTWLKEQQGHTRLIQWGSGDMRAIVSESKQLGIPMCRFRVNDLKSMYQLLYQPAMRLPKKYGLGAAVGDFRGKPHDAYWDAYNTGRLALRMFKSLEKVRKIGEIYGS